MTLLMEGLVRVHTPLLGPLPISEQFDLYDFLLAISGYYPLLIPLQLLEWFVVFAVYLLIS